MVHQRDGLALRLEAGQNRLGVPTLDADQLHRHPTLHRFGLIGHPHGAHAAFADLLEQLILARDDGARRRRKGRGSPRAFVGSGFVERLRSQQGFDPCAQRGVAAADAVEQCRPVGDRGVECQFEQGFFGHGGDPPKPISEIFREGASKIQAISRRGRTPAAPYTIQPCASIR